MNKFIARMTEAANQFIKSEATRKAEIEKLDAKLKAGLIAPVDLQAHKAEIAAIHEQNASAQRELRQTIQTILSDFDAAVDAWAQVRGEHIHDDAALLSSNIMFTRKDLEVLAARHWTNNTMQRLLVDYGRAHEITFAHAPTPERKKETMAEIAKFISGVAGNSYNAAFIQKESAMTEYLEKFEPIIGDSGELEATTSTKG